MSHPPHLLANRPARPAPKRPGRRVASLLLVAGLTVSAMTALAASPAHAASVCAPGADICVITDTFLAPPAAANSFALPGLAIVSIHPPGPCRVRTSGTAVVFTPVFPPGPPT